MRAARPVGCTHITQIEYLANQCRVYHAEDQFCNSIIKPGTVFTSHIDIVSLQLHTHITHTLYTHTHFQPMFFPLKTLSFGFRENI